MTSLTTDLRNAYQKKYNVFLVTSFIHGVWWARVQDKSTLDLVEEKPYTQTTLLWDDIWKAVYNDNGPLHR